MPGYIVKLLILLGGFLLVALVARTFLVDPSYYKYGYYRADAVPELAAIEPVYQGTPWCLTCHLERQVDWSIGAHGTVQCEVCHGTDAIHPESGITMIPADTVRLCTICHAAMPARPATHPQIVVGDHPFPGEETPPCHTCHNPHSPEGWVEDAVAADMSTAGAAIDPDVVVVPDAASKCAKCHGKQGEGLRKFPPIAGLDTGVFIEAMNQYVSGERDSKAMARYARELSAREIAQLAAYYGALTAPTGAVE